MEKFLLCTLQITNQILYKGNLLRRGVKRERLFEKKKKVFAFHTSKTVHGKSLEKGCERERLFEKK